MKSQSALDTPMMRQYLALKSTHPDSVLFYRMGDFYELFLDDAQLAAPLLDIALTTRDKGKEDAVPMCGVPVHSADGYIKRLAELGHRVAICEQVENAKDVGGKRLVRREVVEVITPGLVGDPVGIDSRAEVSVVAVHGILGSQADWGLATLDASTGDFRATSVSGGSGVESVPELLLEELRRIGPREILLTASNRVALNSLLEVSLPATVVTEAGEDDFDPATTQISPSGFDSEQSTGAMRAAAAVLAYLGANQPAALAHAPRLRVYELSESMILDAATRSHLEIFANSEDGGGQGTLFRQLDVAACALGSRRLARWLRYPLIDANAIRERQETVAFLAERDRARGRLRDKLGEIRDLERLLARAVRPTAVPRDLGALRSSLSVLPELGDALFFDTEEGLPGHGGQSPRTLTLPEPVDDLVKLLSEGLVDDPPVIARGSRGASETGYIRPGFLSELDLLNESAAEGRTWIAGLEARERESSGIANLKVRYHPVHGYSLEVPKTQLARVPENYTRKQTLANVERFSTPELSDMEGVVMGANERAAALEREVLESLRVAAVAQAHRVRAAADVVGDLDAFASLAEVARREGWVRPEVHSGDRLQITEGRHPVIEAVLRRSGTDEFVPNDTDLDPGETQLLVLTGPNMSGKSTYLRQVALIVLLAQTGSWVPASQARIGVVDRIFTRVGASDRLSRGESTFMVEMRETAEILSQASRRSLIILDEIGRGTSTFDGLAIAWAVVEYLHDTPGLSARTLFATHYHELTDLARTKPRVRNGHFQAREWKDEVVFLRRLVAGGASRSYGIQVAKLAGLPGPVIDRAKRILRNLEDGEFDSRGRPRLADGGDADDPSEDDQQLALAIGGGSLSPAEQEVLGELAEVDANAMTPIEALQLLERWTARVKEPASG